MTARLAIIGLLFFTALHNERTPDDWLRLVTALEKQERCLYGPDRAFLREMINALTIDENAMPNAAQQKWIRSLERECKI
jgi:hypothetical protein